ncbi:unnamed protein product, partial [Mesorhabditis belari]|uniref:ZP domain-containing protein n=1 Tax=Mesorhabditis belari TaxID=2138241 RepID=A0AAF3F2C4_9BILA
MNLGGQKLNLQYSLFLLFISISSALKPIWKTAPRDAKNNISLIASRSQRASNPSLIDSKPGPPSYYTLPENFQGPVPPPFHSFFPKGPFNRLYPAIIREPPAPYVPISQVPIAPYPPLSEVKESYSSPSTTREPSREPSAPSATPNGYFEERVTSTTQPQNGPENQTSSPTAPPREFKTAAPRELTTSSYQLESNPKDFPDQRPYPEPIPSSQVYSYSGPTRPPVSTSVPYYPRPVHEQPYAPDLSLIPPTFAHLAPPKCSNYVCEIEKEKVTPMRISADHPPTLVISNTVKEKTPNESRDLEDSTKSPFDTNPYEEVIKNTHPPGGLVYPPPLELTTRRNLDEIDDLRLPTAPPRRVIEIVTNGPYEVPENPSVLTPSPTIPQRALNPYGIPEAPAITPAPPQVPVATRRIPDAYNPPEAQTRTPTTSKAPEQAQEGPYGPPADDVTTALPTTVGKRIEYQTRAPIIELRTEAHPPSSPQIPSSPPSIRPPVTEQTEILYEYLVTTPPNAEDVTLSNDVPTRFTYSPPLVEYLETTPSKFPSIGDDFPRNEDDKHEDLTPEREMIETTQVKCGIRNSEENPLESRYHLEIVVMINQPNGTTDLQTFMAQCEQQRVYYNKQKLPKRIEEALEELHLVASRIEQKATIPQVEMKILIDEHHELGGETSTAELGTHLAVQWKLIPESDAYGFHVHNCVVRDSFNGIEHQIIDQHGCSTDLQILTHPHYDTYHDQAAAKLWAFKIPDHSMLSIRCDVLICSDIPSTQTNLSSCATVPTPPFCPDLITSAPNSIAFDFGKSNRKRESLGEFMEEDMISESRTISVKAAYCIGEECKNKPKERHPYCVDVWWATVSSGFTLSAFALSLTVNTVVRFTKRD